VIAWVVNYGVGFVIGTAVLIALVAAEGGALSRATMKEAGRELWLPGLFFQYTIGLLIRDLLPFARPGAVVAAMVSGRVRGLAFIGNFSVSFLLLVIVAGLPMVLLFVFQDDFSRMTSFVYGGGGGETEE
jgi:hypothetical protein